MTRKTIDRQQLNKHDYTLDNADRSIIPLYDRMLCRARDGSNAFSHRTNVFLCMSYFELNWELLAGHFHSVVVLTNAMVICKHCIHTFGTL